MPLHMGRGVVRLGDLPEVSMAGVLPEWKSTVNCGEVFPLVGVVSVEHLGGDEPRAPLHGVETERGRVAALRAERCASHIFRYRDLVA